MQLFLHVYAVRQVYVVYKESQLVLVWLRNNLLLATESPAAYSGVTRLVAQDTAVARLVA